MYAQSPIQNLAEKLIEARGLDYSLAYKVLKEYLKGLSDIEFLNQMSKVDNPNIFRYLWSVGLNLRQQETATMRWKELTE